MGRPNSVSWTSLHGPLFGILFFFTGNDAIHALTKDGKQMLRIDLQKFSREKAHAMYSSFFVESEANKYRLKLGTFNGTKGLGNYLSFVL